MEFWRKEILVLKERFTIEIYMNGIYEINSKINKYIIKTENFHLKCL